MPSKTQEYMLWVVTVLTGVSTGQFPDAEYCGIPCSPRQQHTMCVYKPIGPNCRNVKRVLDENGRMKILSLHNSMRNALASGELKGLPSSSNMRQLYWDIELEAIAERWALQCNASYNDECRNVNRFKVGQVMSKSNLMTTDASYYEALLTKLWFPEMKNLKEDIIMNYKDSMSVKHIAQILSANTMRIGCADVIYTTAMDPKSVRMTVCNYGPAITDGEQIFRIGNACSECPEQTECRGGAGKYPHLCRELRNFEVVEIEKSVGAVTSGYREYDISNVDMDSQVFDKERGYTRIKHRSDHHIPGSRSTKLNPEEVLPGARDLDEDIADDEEYKDDDDNAAVDDKAKTKEQSTEQEGETSHMDVQPPSEPAPTEEGPPDKAILKSSELALKPADVLTHLIGHTIIAVMAALLKS